MSSEIKLTPMLQQYLEIKEQYTDAILFFRMGDFYEMFFEDAVTASRVLGITLTSRNSKSDKDKIPLCGVPYHAVTGYLAKLVQAGFKVAICEQVEDPSLAQGIVKREVVRVVTPGLITDEQLLDDKSNCYIASLKKSGHGRQGNTWGLSFLDLSTGEFLTAEFSSIHELIDELARMAPSELLLQDSFFTENAGLDKEIKQLLELIDQFLPKACLTQRADSKFQHESARETLLEHFNTVNLAGFGCDTMRAGISAAGALLDYIQETQKTNISHIEKITPVDLSGVLIIDDSSRRNLEITQTIVGTSRDGSLLATLDFTRTPMGARLLKKKRYRGPCPDTT